MVVLETLPLQEDDNLSMENNFIMNEGLIHGINKDVPEIGMKFDSEELAYDYYNRYARNVGFSIRKDSTTHRKDKTISRRVLVCSNEGKYRQHPRGSPLKRRLHSRTGCEAKLVIKLQNDDSKYSIVEFVEKHNHVLTCSDQVHLLRSQRKIESSQARLIENMHHAGISQKNIFAYLSVESGGSQNLNFTQMDCDNHIQRRRRQDVLGKGDAEHLLEYFQEMQKENPYFFYAIEMDATGQLCNCFWSDAKCRMDYSFFCDVLVFDTTFGTNDYDKPFAPFIGVNNHGHTTLFGCALLLDESTDSFVWLFKTFLNAMNGIHPQTIFTDQAAPIMKAIKQVFPDTHHRLCLWHIYQLAAKHLSHVFAKSEFFAEDFKSCIYQNETEEESESMWKSLLKKYKLTENKWLKTLYKKKEKWAQVYGRLHFCAGMTTTQRSEGMNSFLKKYFKRTLSLKSFVFQYDKVLTRRRDKEKLEDFRSMQEKPALKSHWPLEARASERYTAKMFSLFQKEYTKTLELILEIVDQEGPVYTYKVTSFEFSCVRTVLFNSLDNSIQCSCKYFQFMGMICSHSMKILHTHQVYDLPSQYFLSRWTVDAKNGVGVEEPKKQIQRNNGSSTLVYSDLARTALSLAMKGTSTETSSAFTKKLLTGVLGELDNFLKSTQDDQEEKIISVPNENNENMGQTSFQLPMSANITLRAPPRSKKSSKKARRIKSSVEKVKVKRRRKSVLRKEKQAKKPTKTKPVTGKRKRSARYEPAVEKEKAKKKTTQMKVVRKDRKVRKPQSADSNVEEVIFSDSDVEEATIFGSVPPSALEVDKNGVNASLLGSSTLQQDSTSSFPYYCPQLLVEEPLTLEGEGTHNLVENQSFLALMLD